MVIDTEIELLRFVTAGSVDDGKSTLIGRMLYDKKSIFEDQLEAIKKTSQQRGNDYIDLSLLTDGLKAEREQGITIDVAYRYFSTNKRKFIIADTPGHIQYTRNMITGASNANLIVILIDATKGITEQTRRHAFIASLLQIAHVVVCINKMDLVNFSNDVFENISNDFRTLASKLELKDIHYVPVSALRGDNVVDKSENMQWYNGATLMYVLETIHISSDSNHIDCRFPVQYVIRPQTAEHANYRGYAGRIASGVFKEGDIVKILPSGLTSKIKTIDIWQDEIKSVKEAFPPMSVTVTLEDDIDVSRGNMLVRENNLPNVATEFDAMICWMNEQPLVPGKKYFLKHTTNQTLAMIMEVVYIVDVASYHRNEEQRQVRMNDIGRLRIKTSQPVFFDSYRKNKITGSFILIDEHSNDTVAAGMII